MVCKSASSCYESLFRLLTVAFNVTKLDKPQQTALHLLVANAESRYNDNCIEYFTKYYKIYLPKIGYWIMNTIIRRALERYAPDVLKLDSYEQDKWKLQDHPDIDDDVCMFVRDHLNLTDNVSTIAQKLAYNKIMLHYTGIGSNYFMLNECDWGSDVLVNETLYEFNTKRHIFREGAVQSNNVLTNLFADWARVEIDGNFFYLNVDSIQQWIFWQVDDVVLEWIDTKIPNEYIPGPEHGMDTEHGTRWDMEINAYGRENEHDIIRRYAYDLTVEIYKNHTRLDDAVYIFDDNMNQEYDPQLQYVFGSIDVLRQIKFTTFVEDCAALRKDPHELFAMKDDIISQIINKLEAKLDSVT